MYTSSIVYEISLSIGLDEKLTLVNSMTSAATMLQYHAAILYVSKVKPTLMYLNIFHLVVRYLHSLFSH
jgi:hypothetical protein